MINESHPRDWSPDKLPPTPTELPELPDDVEEL
jgi:hypothetical protein